MKFKLGVLIGAGIGYLVASGKGKELLDQVREQGKRTVRQGPMSGRPATSGMPGTVGMDAGLAPDAYGATLLASDAMPLAADELGIVR